MQIDWGARIDEIGPIFRNIAHNIDRDGSFVTDNYTLLAERGILSAAVPRELGGGGASLEELARLLSRLAHYCSSTALALSMHQHLVAAAVWRYLHDQPAEALLRRVAGDQIVLVSTGGADWLKSNGALRPVPGGYLLSAIKPFASGSPSGDLVITSAVLQEPEKDPQVLHFSVPMSAPGVIMRNDWDALGMRGTGSNTLEFKEVFIPDTAISVRRPQAGWPGVWSVVATIAPPIYCAPYVGIAERAAIVARELLIERQSRGGAPDPSQNTEVIIGEMENALLTAHLAFDFCIQNAQNYEFQPDVQRANRTLQAKTILVSAVTETVNKAMEAVGGSSYLRKVGLEQLFRDLRGAAFHPLPEKRQQWMTGRLALGLSPA